MRQEKFDRCHYVKKNGEQCRKMAVLGSNYCHIHNQVLRNKDNISQVENKREFNPKNACLGTSDPKKGNMPIKKGITNLEKALLIMTSVVLLLVFVLIYNFQIIDIEESYDTAVVLPISNISTKLNIREIDSLLHKEGFIPKDFSFAYILRKGIDDSIIELSKISPDELSSLEKLSENWKKERLNSIETIKNQIIKEENLLLKSKAKILNLEEEVAELHKKSKESIPEINESIRICKEKISLKLKDLESEFFQLEEIMANEGDITLKSFNNKKEQTTTISNPLNPVASDLLKTKSLSEISSEMGISRSEAAEYKYENKPIFKDVPVIKSYGYEINVKVSDRLSALKQRIESYQTFLSFDTIDSLAEVHQLSEQNYIVDPLLAHLRNLVYAVRNYKNQSEGNFVDISSEMDSIKKTANHLISLEQKLEKEVLRLPYRNVLITLIEDSIVKVMQELASVYERSNTIKIIKIGPLKIVPRKSNRILFFDANPPSVYVTSNPSYWIKSKNELLPILAILLKNEIPS